MRIFSFLVPSFCLLSMAHCVSSTKGQPPGASLKGTSQPHPSRVGDGGGPDGLSVPFSERHCGCRAASSGDLSCEDFALNDVRLGSFLFSRPTNRLYIVAAPHGGYDTNTDLIVANVFGPGFGDEATNAQWGKVVAYGFRGICNTALRPNVNRPNLLGRDGCRQDPRDQDIAKATKVYARYVELLDSYGPRDSQKLYVEIHGQSTPGLESTIEIATERVSQTEAQRIREIFQQEASVLRLPNGVTINIAIEPLERIRWNAIPTKDCGSVRHVAPTPAIHAETPAILRSDERSNLSILYFTRVLSRIASDRKSVV